MKCDLFFYTARKTALCETALRKFCPEMNLTLEDVCFASNSEKLGALLNYAFSNYNIVFVIGNIGAGGEKSVENVIAAAMSVTKPDEYKKIKNDGGEDGYLFRLGKQILIVLPDEPAQIENILCGPLSDYIKALTSD